MQCKGNWNMPLDVILPLTLCTAFSRLFNIQWFLILYFMTDSYVSSWSQSPSVFRSKYFNQWISEKSFLKHTLFLKHTPVLEIGKKNITDIRIYFTASFFYKRGCEFKLTSDVKNTSRTETVKSRNSRATPRYNF